MLTEEQEQCLLVDWLELKKYKFSALPLSTYTKSWAIKMRNKKMGVRAGVPDMMIIINDKLVFIEMKRTKGGVVSEEQKEWIDSLSKCGINARVCKGFDEAKKFIESI